MEVGETVRVLGSTVLGRITQRNNDGTVAIQLERDGTIIIAEAIVTYRVVSNG